MSPLVNPEQIGNLFSADGVHSYVERHYGAKAGKLAGTVVVGTLLLFCVAVCWAIGSAAVEAIRAVLNGAAWPRVAGADLIRLAVPLVTTGVLGIVLWRRMGAGHRAVDDALSAFATATKDRFDSIDAHRTEHFEFFSKRLAALERHTRLPGADPLFDTLMARYEEQAKAKRLDIISASYGADGRANDVTQLLRALASATDLRVTVTNETMGGDPGLPVNLVRHECEP